MMRLQKKIFRKHRSITLNFSYSIIQLSPKRKTIWLVITVVIKAEIHS